MSKQFNILLSFDVEEFDIPLEYGQAISPEEQLTVGKAGLDAINPLLAQKNLATTLFTTAHFAASFPAEIKRLAAQHEIASHTYYHSQFEVSHLATSRQKLEAITGATVTGLRMPRLRPVNVQDVLAAGYQYDSSINPTWLPGRYDNRHLSRTVYNEDGLLRVPASVTPQWRIPLFWLAFKNLPYSVFLKMALKTLRHDGYVCLYFHPWEFVDLTPYKLPGYVKRGAGEMLKNKLYRLVTDLGNEGSFIGMNDFLASHPVK